MISKSRGDGTFDFAFKALSKIKMVLRLNEGGNPELITDFQDTSVYSFLFCVKFIILFTLVFQSLLTKCRHKNCSKTNSHNKLPKMST